MTAVKELVELDSDGDPIPSVTLPEVDVWEKLTDEEACLFAILSDHSGIDLMEFCVVDESQPWACWRAWPFQWPWWRDHSKKQVDQCVAGGQLVLTRRGHVPIEQVQVGDEVLTHRGRWRAVTHVWDRGERDVVAVRGQGHPGLVVTPDHALYARRARRASQPRDGHKRKLLEDPGWLAPSEWEWNDGSGRMAANWASPAAVAACPLPSAMEPAYRSGRQNLVRDVMSPSWLWLYGLFIAEGSTYDDGRYRRAVWSVHPDEVDTVTKHLDLVGLNWSTERVGGAVNIRVSSAPAVRWLREHAGHLAHGKRLATWVYGLPEDQRRAVFEGMVYGDGYTDGTRTAYSTVSRDLAFGMRILAQTLGYSASVVHTTRAAGTIDGRLVRRRSTWSVELRVLADQPARRQVQMHDGHAWAPVTRITPAGTAHVYDLEVDDDHSFVVEGVVVHNCARAIGKSQSLKGRALSFPFRQAGQEMVITAPQQMHVDTITDQIENALNETRLLREMLVTGRSGINHRPFKVTFANGARIISRIPQRTGLGVKGCFVAGTMIETRGGLVPIEKVGAGDLVRTHELKREPGTGRLPSPDRPVWCRVEATHVFKKADVVDIAIDGHAGIRCSIDQPLLCRVGELVDVMTDDMGDWERADDIRALLDAGDEVWVASAARHDGKVCQFEDDEGRWFSKVLSVTDAGVQTVFDLTVEQVHSYVANGIYAHNTHPVCLEMDEAQDYPDRGWTEIFSTFNSALEGAEWRIHGVTRGIPDEFQRITTKAEENGFTCHRYTAVHRPTWTLEERDAAIHSFGGSENSPDFRRNVYGEHGDTQNRLFDLRRFGRCVDQTEASEYNLDEYMYRRITAEMIEDRVERGSTTGTIEDSTDEHAAALIALCDFPARHKRAGYQKFWCGMDVGITTDPTEILIAAEYKPDAKEARENHKIGIGVPLDNQTRLKVLTRIQLNSIPAPLQMALIMHIIEFYEPVAFSMDKTGNGLPVFQGLQGMAHKSRIMVVDDEHDLTAEQREKVASARKTLTVVKGYDFGSKVVVDIDASIADDLPPGLTTEEIVEKAGVRRNVKEWATEKLRELVDNYRILLPKDDDIYNQWNGQTWKYDQSPVDKWGKRRQQFSEGVFHSLDAGRMLALGYFQAPIEALLKEPPKKRRPVLTQFVQ